MKNLRLYRVIHAKSSLYIFFARFPAFSFRVVCFCMRVSGDFLRAPSIPESSRSSTSLHLPAAGAPATAATAHQSQIVSGLALFENIHTWWYTRLDLNLWATSRHEDDWRPVSRNPDADLLPSHFPDCSRDASNGISRLGDIFRTEQLLLLYFLLYILDAVPFIPSRPSCWFYVGESSLVSLLQRSAEESAPWEKKNYSKAKCRLHLDLKYAANERATSCWFDQFYFSKPLIDWPPGVDSRLHCFESVKKKLFNSRWLVRTHFLRKLLTNRGK